MVGLKLIVGGLPVILASKSTQKRQNWSGRPNRNLENPVSVNADIIDYNLNLLDNVQMDRQDTEEYKSYHQDSLALDSSSPFFLEHVSRYIWISKLLAGKNVADIACGKGYGSYIMAKEAASVTGIDLNDKSLEIANSTFDKSNLSYLKHNAVKLGELDKKFDTVVACEIIEHIYPKQSDLFLQSIKDCLKDDGLAYISTPNHDVVLKSGSSVPDFHINNFRASELKSLLEKHFSEVTMLGQYRQRSGLNQFFFSIDYLNIRHLVKRVISSLRATSVNSESNTGESSKKERMSQEFFDQTIAGTDSYRFSDKYWRQSGLTLAICKK
jgi:2-polyprenyl-3-methyl-5-hydroxy-6-metoxy-1,4-benzoquinol methylase